jgi:hypothetical protein
MVTDPDSLRATREERESVATRARSLVAERYPRLREQPPTDGSVLAVVATRDGRVLQSAVEPTLREAAL